MLFEWDEAKRLSNLEKHGLDFNDVDLPFAGPHIESETKTVGGERRSLLVGRLAEQIVGVIFTRRREHLRVISIRRARRDERAQYHARFGS